MTTDLIRYRTHPEKSDENAALVAKVFEELSASGPQGVRYLVLRLEDGSFLHLVDGSPADRAALTGLPAFKAFQQAIKDRCAEPPNQKPVTVVGHYRALTSD